MRLTAGRTLLFLTVVALSLLVGHDVVTQAQTEDGDALVARIGDIEIRQSDLDRQWSLSDAATYLRVRRESYEARRRALDELLGNRLVAREARRQGLSTEELLEREAARRMKVVTEAEVNEFIRSMALPQGLTPQQAMPTVAALLRRRAQQDAREEYLRTLRSTAGDALAVLMAPPRVSVPRASHNPVRGRVPTPVEIVVFADFECPFCRRVAPVLNRLLTRFSSEASLVWKHYPLSSHQHARQAAEAAQCAHDQNKFWEFHDALFEDQGPLTPPTLLSIAKRVGIDAPALAACQASDVHRRLVEEDSDAGTQAGVTGTPTVFINGIALVGALSYETYERTVLDELERIAKRQAARVEPPVLEP